MQIQFPTRAIPRLGICCLGCLWLVVTLGCQNGPLQQQASSGFDSPILPSALAKPRALADVRSNSLSNESKTVVRGQSPDSKFWYGNNNVQNTTPAQTPAQSRTVHQAGAIATTGNQQGFAKPYTPGSTSSSDVQKATYQYPELPASRGGRFVGNGLNSPNIGDPNQLNPIVQPFERGGNATSPLLNNQNGYFPATDYADLDVTIAQTNTGRVNIGGAYNSDNGIVGQFIIDEKDFDITRFPRNFQDVFDGNAWRGGGQAFRLEVVPGQDLQRYLVSFTEPYFLGTDYSFSASGYLFDRSFFDWDENRLGGRFSIGRRLTPDLSVNAGLRLESVRIDNQRLPDVLVSPQLNKVLDQTSDLYVANVGLIRDTRDHPFLPTKGSYLSTTFNQAFGDFDYTRIDAEYRRYRLIYERPDRSGRHTISYGTKLGFISDDAPVFEHYFAGGFSTFRGFDFRGVGPKEGTTFNDDGSIDEGGIRIGGEFQWLNTVEYTFPLTADDMVKGVLFCDFGTIDADVSLDNFRVAPGFGFRVNVPALGLGAPLAFDFAFPVATADDGSDDEKVFSFYLGVIN